MAQTYTRQSSFADGDTITAALFNNEYNQLVNAFAYSSSNASTTGHRHDGTAGQGGNIPQIGDLDFLNKIVVDSTNNRWGIFVEVSGSAVEQIRFQDGALLPVTDSDVDLGTSLLYFKDAFIDSITTTGNVAVGGNLTVTGTTTFNGGTITMGDAATDNVVFGADVDSNIIPDDDNTYDLGSSSQEWKDLYVDGIAYLDGINFNGTAITSTAAELNILDGVTSTAAELNILDGVTSTTAELNILDGVTASTSDLNILDGVTATTIELNKLDGVTASAADINLIDGITNGTVIASKAIITDSNKDITGGRNITISGQLAAATLDISGDVDVDGTLEADAITVNGTTLAETISDTVGAMVTSNTETGVTVTYDDSDNTLDFVIGTLNQDTTGTAATVTTAAQPNITSLGTLTGLTVDGDVTFTGSSSNIVFDKSDNALEFPDDAQAKFGTGNDLVIDHSSSTGVSRIIDNSGTLNIQQSSDDGQIRFQCDDGSGGVSTYYQIDGQFESNTFLKDIKLGDDVKAQFGTSNDLQIFHNGTVSNIKDQGTGILQLTTNGDAVQIYDSANTTTMARFNTGGSVALNHAGTTRFQTTANGINVNGTIVSDAETAFSTTANTPNASLVVGNTASTVASGEYKGAVGFARGSDTTQVRSAIVGKQTDTSANKQGLAFLVHPNSVAGTLNEALLITHNSKIGIGTTSPSEILTVAGNIANVSGDMTLDVAGDIILDADDGFINLKDGGTEFGTLFKSSDSFFIKNPIVDGDIKFQVNDGGSGVVAFQIDASDAGTVIFNNKVGIGTTSPSSILDVAGSAPILTITDTRDQSFSVGDTMSSLAFDSNDASGGAGSASHPRATINLVAENTFGSITGLSFTTKGDTSDASVERMRIDSSGNVGIGTTSPSHELTVGDANAETTIGIAGNRSQFGFKSDLAIVQGGSGKGIQFNVNNNTFGSGEAMRINSSGNVGIGTTSPASVLTYSGSFNATSAGSKPSLTGAGSYGGGIGFVDTNVSGMYTDGSGANLRLFTNQSGSDRADAKIGLSIDGSQNVGIGTTSPDATLHVSGTTTITGNTVFNSGNRAAGNSSAMIRANSGFSSASTPDFTFFFNDQVGLFHPSSGTLGFTIDGSEAMRLDSSENLLVGSTTDHEGKVQIAATNEAGLFVRDSNTSNAAPYLRVQGQRSDGNTGESFTGGLVLESYRTDAAVPDDKALGTIYFGGNHTNGTESNISYAASIVGIAEGAFNSATDMPTGLAFLTGDAGTALKTANTSFGTERMRIDHDGKVGIGTASPASLLHIEAASAPTLRIDDSDSTNALTLAQDGANGSILLGSAGELSIGVTNDSSSDAVSLKTRNSTRLYVAENGRVGIGTTSPDVPFQVEAGQNVLVQLEATHTDGNARMLFKPKDNNGWNIGANDDGSFTIFDVVASTNSVVVETGAAASTLVVDSNSRVGIGTASPTEKLTVAGAITTTGALSDDRTSTGAIDFSSGVTRFVSYGASSTDGIFAFRTAQGGASSTERMRIDGSGRLLIGTTSSAVNDTGIKLNNNGTAIFTCDFTTSNENFIFNNNNSTGTNYVIDFRQNNATKGSISVGGSATAYNTSSDARLKDVTGSARGLEVINELNPVAYNWKVDGKADEGLIAQEVLDVVPNAVSGSEEDMYQMDYSKLVVHLVAGMKEQQKQIEALQSEINELKNS